MTGLTLESAKAQAKALRAALAEAGTPISHSQALELIAHQNGARDWNVLSTRLARQGPAPLQLHDRVRGSYLGQAFTGQIVSLSRAGKGIRVAIQFDKPVDAVRFESFSNLRRRVTGTLGPDGRSFRKTSDDQPQLIVRRIEDAPLQK